MSHVMIERNFNPNIIISKWGKLNQKVAEKIKTDVGNYLHYYGLEAIKRYFPKGGKGILEGSLKVYDESVGYQIRFSIRSDNPEYGEVMKILEYGSPPHTITPNIAEALAFKPQLMRFNMGFRGLIPMAIWGDQIFRNRVNHPGNRAYRMFQSGMNDMRPELLGVVRGTVKTVIEEVRKER